MKVTVKKKEDKKPVTFSHGDFDELLGNMIVDSQVNYFPIKECALLF